MYTNLLLVYIQYLSNQTLTVLKYLNSYCDDRAKLPVKLDPLTLLVLNLRIFHEETFYRRKV